MLVPTSNLRDCYLTQSVWSPETNRNQHILHELSTSKRSTELVQTLAIARMNCFWLPRTEGNVSRVHAENFSRLRQQRDHVVATTHGLDLFFALHIFCNDTAGDRGSIRQQERRTFTGHTFAGKKNKLLNQGDDTGYKERH